MTWKSEDIGERNVAASLRGPRQLGSSLLVLIVWIAVLLFHPVLASTVDLYRVLLFTVFFLGVCGIGEILTAGAATLRDLGIGCRLGLSFLIGSVITCVLLWWVSLLVAWVAIAVAAVAFVVVHTRRCRLEGPGQTVCRFVIPAALALLVVQSPLDRYEAHSSFPIQVPGQRDNYSDVMWTHSLAYGNMFDAFYDRGAPINYQLLSYFGPAATARMCGTSAQVSLRGIWMPFYTVLGLLLLAEAALIVVDSQRPTKAKWSWGLAMLIGVGLAPINPKYLFGLDISSIVWLGVGYLLPGGSPPMTGVFCWVGACAFMLLRSGADQEWRFRDSLVFTLVLASSAGVKLAMFLPLVCFVSFLAAVEAWHGRYRPLVLCVIGSIAGVGVYHIFFGHSGGMSELYLVPYGIGCWPAYFAEKSGLEMGALVMLACLFWWGGVRLLLAVTPLVSERELNRFTAIGPAAVGSIAVCCLPPVFVRLRVLDSLGRVIGDDSFNMDQFVRAAFLFLTLAGTITVLWMTRSPAKHHRWVRHGLVLGVAAYCTLCIVSNVWRSCEYRLEQVDSGWRDEVRSEAAGLPVGLWAISSDITYPGQLLAAEGIGPWWLSGRRHGDHGYVFTNVNYYRQSLMDRFLEHGVEPDDIAKQMKAEGVTYLVATPRTRRSMTRLAEAGLLQPIDGSKWIFRWSRL